MAPSQLVQPVDRWVESSPSELTRADRPRHEALSSPGFAFQGHLPSRKPSDLLKRAVDVTVGTFMLAVSAPVMGIVAIAIRFESAGPVVVSQVRMGKDLRPFRLYKFRSMSADAAALRDQIRPLNDAAWPLFKIRRDPRVTRVGRVLRRFSLDELPQLVNVLRGEMSLVGPRPPLPDELDVDFVRQAHRLRAVPGMTGLWQVSGRSDLDYVQMVRLDLRYTRVRSVLLDVAILLRTIPAAVSGRGAY